MEQPTKEKRARVCKNCAYSVRISNNVYVCDYETINKGHIKKVYPLSRCTFFSDHLTKASWWLRLKDFFKRTFHK